MRLPSGAVVGEERNRSARTNAIHGIVLVGAIVVAGLPHQATWIRIVALAAVALGTMNVVGGFVVTDRMLGMFKRRRKTDESS